MGLRDASRKVRNRNRKSELEKREIDGVSMTSYIYIAHDVIPKIEVARMRNRRFRLLRMRERIN